MVDKNAITETFKRAATDILLIVVGVSIALTGDSWLAQRAENARTNQLLDALEAEWAAELVRMDTYLDELSQAKLAIITAINANRDNPPKLTASEAASLLRQTFRWGTFKPSDGALNTLLVDGLQNIDDTSLRMAVASWRTVLAEIVAEQAALRELGTLSEPMIGARIAQESRTAYSSEADEYSYDGYGMDAGIYALAAFADDEFIANKRHLLDLLNRYQKQLVSIRATLERNLTMLQERPPN